MIRCDILTLFPEIVMPNFEHSMLKRARENRLLDLRVHQLREFASDKHHMTDDAPYGGGSGMVLKPEPIFTALDKIKSERKKIRIILPTPQGKRFDQKMAEDFSKEDRTLVFICGHYEGIDARVGRGIGLEEVSVGDYVLTGGELPAVLMIDAAARLVPGVLGGETSAQEESFSFSLLEHPHYTRPYEFRGMRVPDVLTSGNHSEIRYWRRKHALINTFNKRPDLLESASLTNGEREWIEKILLEKDEKDRVVNGMN